MGAVKKVNKDIGKVVGGKSLGDRFQGAVKGAIAGGMAGGPYGAVVGGLGGAAVGGKSIDKAVSGVTGGIKPKGPAKVQLARTDISTLGQSLATKNAAGSAERANPAAMQARTIDRSSVGNVTNQNVTSNLNTTSQDQIRTQQLQLAQALQAQASGQAPSIAEMQAKRAGERALAQQLAARAGAVGPQAALSRREAAREGMATQAEIANQAAILRLQEQQAAQEQLAGLTGQIRGQDITMASTEAEQQLRADLSNADRQLKASLANQGVDLDVLKANALAGNQAAAANLQAELTKLGLDDTMQRAYIQQELDLARLASSENIAQAQIDAGINAAKAKSDQAFTGGLLNAGATLGAAAIAASDKNLKVNIKAEKSSSIGDALRKKLEKSGDDNRLNSWLDNLEVYSYDYKEPEKFGEGRKTSVMAQDLEKSEIGKEAVIETPEGKLVDYSKLLPAMLAANVDANRRISSLEEALKAKLKRGK